MLPKFALISGLRKLKKSCKIMVVGEHQQKLHTVLEQNRKTKNRSFYIVIVISSGHLWFSYFIWFEEASKWRIVGHEMIDTKTFHHYHLTWNKVVNHSSNSDWKKEPWRDFLRKLMLHFRKEILFWNENFSLVLHHIYKWSLFITIALPIFDEVNIFTFS